ncbi:SOS response-associated peptidase family protein [Microbacterium profundi]|uniref:SOS response-associated peptidase family protein n=1 Tax=Microbacterium profundi TaxID=450380 RepID=A0ABV3LI63_9MICO
MCGRFANDAKTDELIREYVAEGGKPEEWWKSWAGAYSIAPTQDAPIVRDRGEGRILEFVRWASDVKLCGVTRPCFVVSRWAG